MKHITFSLVLLVTTSITFAQVPWYVPTQNLVAWYSFDGNTADSSGSNNHLTNNGATLTTDRFGNPNSAYLFDGINDYMTKSSPSFQLGENSSFTVSLWMNKTNTTSPAWLYAHGLTEAQGGTGKFVHFMAATPIPDYQWRTTKQGSTWIIATSTYTANTWEHWVGVYDNKNMKLYKNGVQVNSATYPYTGATTASMPLHIGTIFDVTGNFFPGKIDDIGFWTRALTTTEINNLFNPCTPVTGDTMTVVQCDSFTSASGVTYTSTGIYPDTLQTTLGCDSIITLDLTILSNSTSYNTISSCFQYISPSGNYVWTSSGIYYDTIPNAAGCDSIITVNLTIKDVDTTVSVSNITLTASAAGASYQWLDCNNNFSVIIGATGQSYTAIANGSYAVEITQNGCVDTSFCYHITGIGIDEMNKNTSIFRIYPNPNDGSFIINTDLKSDKFRLEFFDMDGKLIIAKTIGGAEINRVPVSLPGLENGVYYIQISTTDKMYTQKLVIQNSE